ncbi:MAG: hypothetical protein FJX76_22695 [Armatimonadetes bacterium]|nr:hypothetical protein [Armatimonadota bacterium]
MQPSPWLVGGTLAVAALLLRLAIHVRSTPGGVDTWYYLASADWLRRHRRLPVRLPQYLLQDEKQSYPPGFVIFLSLLPRAWLRRCCWVVTPLVDTAHMLLLYAVILTLTNNGGAALVGCLVYALTPQLISETRNLNPRTLGTLLSSVAMLLVFRYLLPAEMAGGLRLGAAPWPVGVLGVGAVTALFLTHSTTAAAFSLSALVISLFFGDWRYLGFAVAGLGGAFVVTGGWYLEVVRNHFHAVRFWRRNQPWRSAHAVQDSPIYGSGGAAAAPRAGWTQGWWRPAVRLLGDNPFLVCMFFLPAPVLHIEWWGQRMFAWAASILVGAVLTTFVRPLRVFGPGHLYMRSAVFPTAFSLALAVNAWQHLQTRIGTAFVVATAASVAAIALFYWYVWSRLTEHTTALPPDLVAVVRDLEAREDGGVLCLPTMYADFVCYQSGKSILWGGHSGDLTKYEALFPVVREPLEKLIERYGVRYVLLDEAYVTAADLKLEPMLRPLSRHGQFVLYST